ncbi:4Fe-4S binding protein [Bacillus sp. FJAT-49705]|uniref:4Fe-4S binding protein n=1 Tax=Cytobacillus citreus TaxID=2833586 RepID=A0ABS5NUN5_9BACI|nr:4Fe-4S binding protein [Cytobacillus citreus]MBS4191544.1 4Fe-4S binding protein [Cytobacillus citreus]
MGLLNKWMESLDYEFKVLQSCTRHQSPYSSCSRCKDVCFDEAITFIDEKPYIDNEKCTECGYCIAECPVQAIEGFFPKRTVVQDQLVVTDEHPPALRELLGYNKKGITAIISEQEKLNENWQYTISKTNEMLEKLNEAPFSIYLKKIELKEESLTRREIFSFWKNEAQSTLKQMTPAKWRFNHEELDIAKLYPKHQFKEVAVNLSKCTLCKACQKLCKKNCFQINDTSFTISAQKCSGCMLCQDICPEKAITIQERIMSATEVDHSLLIKTCKICNNNYQSLVDQSEKCVKCKKQEEFTAILS